MLEKLVKMTLADYHNLIDALNLLNLEIARFRATNRMTGKQLSGIYSALGRVDSIISSCDSDFNIAA